MPMQVQGPTHLGHHSLFSQVRWKAPNWKPITGDVIKHLYVMPRLQLTAYRATPQCQPFIVFYGLIYLKGTMTEKDREAREQDIPSVGSLPEWPQESGLAVLKSEPLSPVGTGV